MCKKGGSVNGVVGGFWGAFKKVSFMGCYALKDPYNALPRLRAQAFTAAKALGFALFFNKSIKQCVWVLEGW